MNTNVHILVSFTQFLHSTGSKNITILYVPLHGSGRNIPHKYLYKQATPVLRKYDSLVQSKLNALVSSTNGSHTRSAIKIRKLDIFSLAQFAEFECSGIFESPDGVHLSLSTQYAVGQLISNYILLLAMP